MVNYKYLALPVLALMVVGCVEQQERVAGKESPDDSILISEIDISKDFTSASFRLTNNAAYTYYSTVIVTAEFRNQGVKIGSERMVIYPLPLFGPDSSYVHGQPLHPATNTDEIHLNIERASFYPENELKALLENKNR